MTDCGGCLGIGAHRRHCRANPNYSRARELADMAEDIGDSIGPNNMAAANACYRAASLLRTEPWGNVPGRENPPNHYFLKHALCGAPSESMREIQGAPICAECAAIYATLPEGEGDSV